MIYNFNNLDEAKKEINYLSDNIHIIIILDDLINEIMKAVKYFRSGDSGTGNLMIIPTIEKIGELIDEIKLNPIYQQRYIVDTLNEKLQEIVEAFQNSDFTLISDLFEYEVIPIFEKWKNAGAN